MLESQHLEKLKKIRRELHTMPEVSGSEKKTAAYIKHQLCKTDPDDIIEGIGGHGIVAIYNGKDPDAGETMMIRAELDGLAIDEQSDIPHKSETRYRMHACGHDGHMAIVLGVAEWLTMNRPSSGRVMLLFQPSEETGEGAARMLEDRTFSKLSIDRGIALHNLPGYKKNTVYIKSDTFALASVGIKVSFRGESSHAAYPEEGVNPSVAMSKFIMDLESIKDDLSKSEGFCVMTTTYVKVGEPAFGINPGSGEMGITIRAEADEDVESLFGQIEKNIKTARNEFPGTIQYEKKEPFAATVNDADGVERLRTVAGSLNVDTETLDRPIAWSEDFGEFRRTCPITLFGLGAGTNTPPLHSELYDFDDDLIETGVSLFCEWINRHLT